MTTRTLPRSEPRSLERRGRKTALALLVGAALAVGAAAAFADAPLAGFSPDPPGHASVKQWVFDVRVQRGKPEIQRTRSASLAQAAETSRVMGRYAIELYVGPELLDRVRFNVPLAGDGPVTEADRPKQNPFSRPSFHDVSTKVRVQMADHPRAAYLALVDRAMGSVERFEWPPGPDGQLIPMKPTAAAASGAAKAGAPSVSATAPAPSSAAGAASVTAPVSVAGAQSVVAPAPISAAGAGPVTAPAPVSAPNSTKPAATPKPTAAPKSAAAPKSSAAPAASAAPGTKRPAKGP